MNRLVCAQETVCGVGLALFCVPSVLLSDIKPVDKVLLPILARSLRPSSSPEVNNGLCVVILGKKVGGELTQGYLMVSLSKSLDLKLSGLCLT